MRPRCLVLSLCSFFLTPLALANDSTAELKTGGLVLSNSSNIEMHAEDLFISSKLVTIHYVFMNTSPHDISTIVAFPMPRITNDTTEDNGTTFEIPNENSDNFLDFSTLVNGRPISARVERRRKVDL